MRESQPSEAHAGAARAAIPARTWLAVLITAALARALVTFVVFGDVPLQSDALQYSEAGVRLVGDFPGTTPYFWPPGLVYLLASVYAVFGHALVVSRIAMIAIGVLSTAGVMWLAQRGFGETRVTAAAGFVAALYPPSVLMSGQTYTQEPTTLTLVVVALALLAQIERPSIGWGLVGGIALGIGVITRPSMQSVVAGVALAGVLRTVQWVRAADPAAARRSAAALALCGIAVGSAAIPVMAHNARLGAGWSLSINNEMNLFMGNNPYTHFYKTSHLAQRDPADLEPEIGAYLLGYIHGPDARTRMRDAAVRYAVEHPFVTAWRTLSRIRAFWGFDYIISRAVQNHRSGSTAWLIGVLLFEAGGYLAAMIAIVSGTIIALRERRFALTAVLVGLALAYQAPYALAFSSGTYHYPVMAVLFPLAALNLARPLHDLPWWRPAERRWLVAAVAVLVLVQIEYGYHTASLSGL